MRRLWMAGLLLLLASGCATPTRGTATEDPNAVASRMFPLAATAVHDNVTDHIQGRYTAYVYLKLGGTQLGNESDVSILGDNPSVLEVRQSKLDPTLRVTSYHPAGDPRDLLKLEGRFTTLAPTPWVSYPTYFPSRQTVTCIYPALDTLCAVERARAATEKASPPGLPHGAEVLADGTVELHSGASFKALLDEKVFTLSDEVSKSATAKGMGTVLPVTIVLDADKKLRSVEVNGEVPGSSDPFVVQLGVERRGPASKADFPAMPASTEITVIPDEQGRAQLWQRIHS
jgi:hypothetical protein